VQRELVASGPQSASSAGAMARADGPSDSTHRDSLRRMRHDSAGRRGQVSGQFRGAGAGGFGGGASRRGTNAGGGRYIVFAKRNGAPTPVWIRTGLTDLDYSEVLSGLQVGDSVYELPSASLVQSQQDVRNRLNQITGGGLPGVRQQQGPSGAAGSGGARPGAGAGR
jgi:hypothetical protein